MDTLKVTYLTFLLSIAAHAQAQLTFTPVGAVALTGQQASVSINIIGGGTNLTAFQATFGLPPGATMVPAATLGTVGKNLALNSVNNTVTIIVSGGVNPLPDGSAAVINFISTPFQFTPMNAKAVDATSNLIAFSGTGLPYGFSRCDLNLDGKLDGLDNRNAQDQADGAIACTNGDLLGHGKCDVQDVQRVATAVAGGVCKVGQ